MSETWLSADLHLGEDRMELMGRPFTTPEEMIDRLVYEHNRLVKPDDKFILVGDVAYQKRPEFLKHIQKFNGRKTLVRGNHDRVFSDSDLAPYFEHIIPDGGGFYIIVDGLKCYVTHYPTEGVADAFNIVGHIHAAWKYQLNMVNVGVDVHHFRPVNLNTIPFHYKAVVQFYDQDVWVAYDPRNAAFQGQRGKKGTYFRPVA